MFDDILAIAPISEMIFLFLSVGDLCSVRSLAKSEAVITKAYMDCNEQKMHDDFETVLEEREYVADAFHFIRTAKEFRRFEKDFPHPNGLGYLNPRADHLAHMERFYRRSHPTWTDEEMRCKLIELHGFMWQEMKIHATWRVQFKERYPSLAAFQTIHEWMPGLLLPHNFGFCFPKDKDEAFMRFHEVKHFFEEQARTRKSKRRRQDQVDEKENAAGTNQ